MGEGQPIDRFAWFLAGVWLGWMALIIFIRLFASDPTETKIKQGWFEHDGKIYRVIPAEVR